MAYCGIPSDQLMFECTGCGAEIPYSSAFKPPGWQGFDVFCSPDCCRAFLERHLAEAESVAGDNAAQLFLVARRKLRY